MSKMHDDEVDTSIELAHQLIIEQFPNFSHLKLKSIHTEGTDNTMYRLGNDMVIRLPRNQSAAITIGKESHWLPQLAPYLPIIVPSRLGKGKASSLYPFPWLIYDWLEGENPNKDGALDLTQAAVDLGNFINAMQKISSLGAPLCNRGKPLISRDDETRESIYLLNNIYDTALITDIWELSLSAPIWQHSPVWIHGDLHCGNILVQNKQISAIIDFGSMGTGDPACDLMVAWTLLHSETRKNFRAIVEADDAIWNRARGWALTFGVVAYPYYKLSNPGFAAIAKRAIDAVVADYQQVID